jgi:hypothetical protein
VPGDLFRASSVRVEWPPLAPNPAIMVLGSPVVFMDLASYGHA